MTRKASVIIIGGGCMGASTAYYLAKLGTKNIVLLERSHLAWGATGKSTAIVRQHYSNEITSKMALEGLRFFQTFETQTGLPTGFRNTGFVLAADETQASGLKQNVDLQIQVGIKTRILTASQLKELQPEANIEDVAVAAYEEESGYADPVQTTQSLGEAARRLDVEILENTEANKIRVTSGHVTEVETTEGTIEGSKVVVAGNVWANRILEGTGVRLPITAMREQNCQFIRPAGFKSSIPVWGDLIQGIYFRPHSSNRIIVGSLESDLPKLSDPDLMPEGADFSTVETYANKLIKRYPIMGNGNVERGWSGPYDVTPDWHPILDELPEIEGLYVAVGFSGHGFKLCPAIGRMMAEFIHNGRKPDGMELFNARRFESGKLIEARYNRNLIA